MPARLGVPSLREEPPPPACRHFLHVDPPFYKYAHINIPPPTDLETVCDLVATFFKICTFLPRPQLLKKLSKKSDPAQAAEDAGAEAGADARAAGTAAWAWGDQISAVKTNVKALADWRPTTNIAWVTSNAQKVAGTCARPSCLQQKCVRVCLHA